MRYYIIAGEASGDLHASNLIKEIKKLDKDAFFRCWGGAMMKAQGAEVVKDYKDLAFMGFAEVLLNIRTIMSNLRFCKEDILSFKPDALILVDYPGFNLRIAEFASKAGLKVFYYISPQVWAWKKSRVHKIKKFVHRMMVILPFEKEFYARYNMHVDFVGHPLLDVISNNGEGDKQQFVREHGLDDRPIIAVLPGSREQEIIKILPVMSSVFDDFNNYQFVIAGVENIPPEFYRRYCKDKNVNIVYHQTRILVSVSYAAIVKSGTSTLETALAGIPQVVCYKGSAISFFLAKRLVDVKFISLVNLIMDKEVVKELIQGDLNKKNLIDELNKILDNRTRTSQLMEYSLLREKLGGAGASAKAAAIIVSK